MKKQYRIKKSEDIEQVLKKKNSVGNKNYIIYTMKDSEANHFRLAMSVSKKLGNAVVRNRQKRLIKQVFTKMKQEILPFDIFVIAKTNSVNLEYLEIENNIVNLLKKANVLNKEK
jgi:ribonuclease P protein component